MSLYDYKESLRLSGESFYSLIMAAMLKADDNNLQKLYRSFPDVYQELKDRYNLPGGMYPEERTNAYEVDNVRED